MDPELLKYLDGKFGALDARVGIVERECSQMHEHLKDDDQIQSKFNTRVLTLNTNTRIAVALIAAIALVGNGSQHALASHDAATLELRCQKGTTEAIDKFRGLQEPRDRALVESAAMRAVQLRDQQIDILRGTP